MEDTVTLNNASWIDRSLLKAVRRAVGTAPISLSLPHVENLPDTTRHPSAPSALPTALPWPGW